MNGREAWHLDKRVPITIIVMFAVQTLTLVYVGTSWKADIEYRVGALEKSMSESAPHESRIIVLEQGFLRIREDLSEIKDLIRLQKQGALDKKLQIQGTTTAQQ